MNDKTVKKCACFQALILVSESYLCSNNREATSSTTLVRYIKRKNIAVHFDSLEQLIRGHIIPNQKHN